MKSKRTLSFTLVVALLAALVLAAGVALWLGPDSPSAGSREGDGDVLIGGPFTLVDQDGRTVTEKNWPGQYLLVYFGYTFCPDVCPTDLQRNAQAMVALEARKPAAAARVQPLFITVDPERDTVAVMKAYVTAFHPRLVGLTGSQAQVDAAKRAYRVYSAKAQQGDTAADYLVDHSALTYLMTPDGKYAAHFSSAVTPEEVAARLGDLVQ